MTIEKRRRSLILRFFPLFNKREALITNIAHYLLVFFFSFGGLIYFLAYLGGYKPVNFRHLTSILLIFHPFYHIISDQNCITTGCNEGKVTTYRYFIASLTIISLGALVSCFVFSYYAERMRRTLLRKHAGSKLMGLTIASYTLMIIMSVLFFVMTIGAIGVGAFKSNRITFAPRSAENEAKYPEYRGFKPASSSKGSQVFFHNMSATLVFAGGFILVLFFFFFNWLLMKIIDKSNALGRTVDDKESDASEIDADIDNMENSNSKTYKAVAKTEEINLKDNNAIANKKSINTSSDAIQREALNMCRIRNFRCLTTYCIMFVITLALFAMCNLNMNTLRKVTELYFDGRKEAAAAKCSSTSCYTAPVLGLNWAEWCCVFIPLIILPTQMSIFKFLAMYIK